MGSVALCPIPIPDQTRQAPALTSAPPCLKHAHTRETNGETGTQEAVRPRPWASTPVTSGSQTPAGRFSTSLTPHPKQKAAERSHRKILFLPCGGPICGARKFQSRTDDENTHFAGSADVYLWSQLLGRLRQEGLLEPWSSGCNMVRLSERRREERRQAAAMTFGGWRPSVHKALGA